MSRESRTNAAMTDALLEVDLRMVAGEVKRLRAIEAWALSTLHVADGDAVVITKPIAATGGWHPYREVLVEGRTGRVHDLYLHDGTWYGLFEPDDCWTVHEDRDREVRRWRKDPAGVFMLSVGFMRRRNNVDRPLPVPDDVTDSPYAKRVKA